MSRSCRMDPVGQAGPVGPAGPGAPVGPAGPAAPVLPVLPVAPRGPVAPVAPRDPDGPGAPCWPCTPRGPVLPRAPVFPVGPGCPAAPGDPGAPAGPGGPAGPVTVTVAVGVVCAACANPTVDATDRPIPPIINSPAPANATGGLARFTAHPWSSPSRTAGRSCPSSHAAWSSDPSVDGKSNHCRSDSCGHAPDLGQSVASSSLPPIFAVVCPARNPATTDSNDPSSPNIAE